MSVTTLAAVGVSGSTSPASRSRTLIERTLAHLHARGAHTRLVDLAALPAAALLAREPHLDVDGAISAASVARILVIGTPIYRASYTGQLKCFFDLFPRGGLVGSVTGLIATGYSDGHRLAIDHGLRPLVASLGGLSVARAIYATDAQLPDASVPPPDVDAQTEALADELWRLAGASVATIERLARS